MPRPVSVTVITSSSPGFCADTATVAPSLPYLIAFLADYELPRAPGESTEYSNLGVGLLGLALANHAGLSYDELVRAVILDPLEMHSTAINSTPAMEAVRAVGHDLGQRPVGRCFAQPI